MTSVLADSQFLTQQQFPALKRIRICPRSICRLQDCRFRVVGSSLQEPRPGATRIWKSSRSKALVAILVVSIWVPSSSAAAAAALVEFTKESAITSCQFAGDDVACGIDLSKAEEHVKLANLSTSVLSSGVASSKLVHTMGTAAIPKVLPVHNSLAISSGSRLLARILQHFGGGGIAGAIGAALVYPLDTIKTRMQAQTSKTKYKNELDCFVKLVSEEGFRSLYSGLLPQLVGIAPEKALKLTVNELLLEFLEHLMPGAGVWLLELIAGSGGGFSQVVFTNPVEIVKVKLQTQASEASGRKKSMGELIKELGVGGLYHGSEVTLARDIPSSAIFFACYAFLKQLYPDQSFIDGFLAAIPATVVTHPMDVVKTRLQMEVPPGETPHKNGLACLKTTWEEEGPRALFKGSLARLMRTSPQFGITLLVYNLICGDSQH